MTMRISTAARNAAADAVVDLIDAGAAAGTLKIYTGSQPATAGTAPTGTLLATVTLTDPAFGAASGGSAAAGDPPAVTAVASGDAGWFRVADSNGNTVYDGAVTASGGGGELQLATVTLSSGVSVDITALTVTMPAG